MFNYYVLKTATLLSRVSITYYIPMYESFHFSTYLSASDIVNVFYFSNSNRYIILVWICISTYVDHLSCAHLPFIHSLWWNLSFAYMLIGLFYCWVSEFYILDMSSLRCMVCKYFLQVCSFSFHPLHMVFYTTKVFRFHKVQFINIFLYILLPGCICKY